MHGLPVCVAANNLKQCHIIALKPLWRNPWEGGGGSGNDNGVNRKCDVTNQGRRSRPGSLTSDCAKTGCLHFALIQRVLVGITYALNQSSD